MCELNFVKNSVAWYTLLQMQAPLNHQIMKCTIFRLSFFLVFLFSFFHLPVKADNKPVKVVFVGASITYGALIENRDQNSYPAQLQKLLGDKFKVYNLGVSGCTMLRKGDYSYWNRPQFKEALSLKPDIVFIDLGGNDAKLVNRVHMNEFEKDCEDMVDSFRALPSNPRIILLQPVASFVTDTTGIWDPVITGSIIPIIEKVAFEKHVELVNLHPLLIDKPQLYFDKIHPNKVGASLTAHKLNQYLIYKYDDSFDAFRLLPNFKTTSFHGYQCAESTFKGHDCKIVKPNHPAVGHPWIWRARFWGHEPQTDIALLENGFHVVYCDVSELFGNKEAVGVWNGFYKLLKKAGFSSKAVLEGMSRGGIYAFNWAAVNPNKVACVYVDNPVLDLKSWPAGENGRKNYKTEFDEFRTDFSLKNENDIRRFHGSPINKIKQIVKGKYNILIVCADADKLVSPAENTLLFEQKVKSEKGKITVIHKPGFDHHPHSFPNPAPIVNFILESTGYLSHGTK